MRDNKYFIAALIYVFVFGNYCFALNPNEILIIANSNSDASVRIAEYYSQKRAVPKENILSLPLPASAIETISRTEYQKQLSEPIRKKLSEPEFKGKIRCLLTTYGIPFKVDQRGMLKGEEENLKKLQKTKEVKFGLLKEIFDSLRLMGRTSTPKKVVDESTSIKTLLGYINFEIGRTLTRIEVISDTTEKTEHYKKWLKLYEQVNGRIQTFVLARQKPYLPNNFTEADKLEFNHNKQLMNEAEKAYWSISKKFESSYYKIAEETWGLKGLFTRLNIDIDYLTGRETNAAVDSELSMVLFNDYKLHRWQKNELKNRIFFFGTKTLMVCRLDGPGEDIAIKLVDKAIEAEKNGLNGVAYIDSRGLVDNEGLYSEGYFDKSLQDTAKLIRARTDMQVMENRRKSLFMPGQCPNTALYCGWYSLQKYIDAFDFVEGAIGFHIASWEAVHLRDANSTEWCPSMLKDGVAATIGAVAEPYLAAIPEPRMFFSELLSGRCLVEAYYKTKPYNSWQMILIGDPLYIPFPKRKSL